jgi:hypothetical protein
MEITSYEINYVNEEGHWIDDTSVYTLDEELIWDLFRESGHTRQPGDYWELDDIIKEEE